MSGIGVLGLEADKPYKKATHDLHSNFKDALLLRRHRFSYNDPGNGLG